MKNRQGRTLMNWFLSWNPEISTSLGSNFPKGERIRRTISNDTDLRWGEPLALYLYIARVLEQAGFSERDRRILEANRSYRELGFKSEAAFRNGRSIRFLKYSQLLEEAYGRESEGETGGMVVES